MPVRCLAEQLYPAVEHDIKAYRRFTLQEQHEVARVAPHRRIRQERLQERGRHAFEQWQCTKKSLIRL